MGKSSLPKLCSVDGCEGRVRARGWCTKHYHRWERHGDPLITKATPWGLTVEERFWSKIDASGVCWEWTDSLCEGYGTIWIGKQRMKAHRWAWEYLIGPIPDGLVIDHLCRNRKCVLPDHLEPVSDRVNIRRGHGALSRLNKTHCPQGHPYSGDNLHISMNGGRSCRTCLRKRGRILAANYRARKAGR